MDKQNNIPQLRFPEFSDAWEVKRLGEVAEISSGGTPSRANLSYWNGTIPWVSTALINFNRIEKTEEYITESGVKNSSAKIFPIDTLLIAMYGQGKTRGKVAILGIESSTNQACAAITVNKSLVIPLFIFQNLSKRYDEIRDLSNQGGQENLSAGIIKNIEFIFPYLPEQTKIANFLSAVDEKLNALKRKKALLEDYKKGVMQQLFAQTLRFKNEDGEAYEDWEMKNGNEVFESISDKNHNSDLPILAITQEYGAIPRDLIDYQVSVTDKSVESYKVVEVGDFIISLRSFQGGIEYSNYRGICSPAYVILRPCIEINRQFYKYYLKTESYIQQLNKNLEGIRDGKMISYKYFSEISLPFPSLPEQTKIANYLSALDEKITQVDKQVTQMEAWKKGLLQQLFV